MNYHYMFKTIFIGNTGVGKSSILQQYADQVFDPCKTTTIGVDYTSKIVKIGKYDIRLQLWDLSGHSTFRNIVSSYYKHAHIVYFVFDKTERSSFTDFNEWIKQLENRLDKIQLVLIGNKLDRLYFSVSKEEGEELAERYHALYYEISAKEPNNLSLIIEEPVQYYYNRFIREKTFAPLERFEPTAPLLHDTVHWCCFS